MADCIICCFVWYKDIDVDFPISHYSKVILPDIQKYLHTKYDVITQDTLYIVRIIFPRKIVNNVKVTFIFISWGNIGLYKYYMIIAIFISQSFYCLVSSFWIDIDQNNALENRYSESKYYHWLLPLWGKKKMSIYHVVKNKQEYVLLWKVKLNSIVRYLIMLYMYSGTRL